MILIDTTVWIEFFKCNTVYFEELESLMESQEVITIEPIFAELLFGSRNKKEQGIIISYWNVLPRITFTEGSFIGAADFANQKNYHNIGIGLIDSILTNAIVENCHLIWTLDKKILNNIEDRFIYKK